MCCEEESLVCEILECLAGCCCCYWWFAIRNEKPPEKIIKRIKSVSGVQSTSEVENIKENVVYAKQSQLKYILPVDIPSQHGNCSESSQKMISEKTGKGTLVVQKLYFKVTKSPLRREKFDKTGESPRYLAAKNSENFVLTNNNGEYKVASVV